MEKDDHKIAVTGFKEKIKEKTELYIKRATKGEGLRDKKDYNLYLRMLQVAWESDSSIDASESSMLAALRDELDISFTEHIILEHHESLKPYWYVENYYERERNHLIASGILNPIEGHFVIAEEMIPLIRKTWGYSLTAEQYKRLLNNLSGPEITEILKKSELHVSGSSEDKVIRIIENHISPRKSMMCQGIENLREVSRKIGSQVSGSKADVINNIIDFMDSDEDLKRKEEIEKKMAPPKEEVKVLSKEAFSVVFRELSNDQIYSIASGLRNINKSGSKEQRIQHLWGSIYSEDTLLNRLSNTELYDLCTKLKLKVAGSKQEKIARITSTFSSFQAVQEDVKLEENTESIISISTKADREKEKEKHSESIEDLKSVYPFLSQDELIILSFLLESKSASGPAIERIVARFDLPWYFPETQMNEMIKKLQDNGRDLIAVQKYGDHPLYQIK
jgi:hypothetical protein